MKALVLLAWVVASVLVGGCATNSNSPSAKMGPVTALPITASLSAAQCRSMGCGTTEAPSCPAIEQDYASRHLACACTNGTSCITQRAK